MKSERNIKEAEIMLVADKFYKEIETGDIQKITEKYARIYNEGLDDDSYRICSHSGDVMTEGYCINDGDEYYKDFETLLLYYTQEEWDEMHNNGEGDSYWTTWG